MFAVIKKPTADSHGIVAVTTTTRTSTLEGQLNRCGFIPLTHEEIKPEQANSSPIALIAIGSKVPHPNHKNETPSYFGYNKKGEEVHVIASHGTINPDIHILVGCK